MKYKFNWLSGLFTGGVIGATVAILSAPRSGEKTRMMIREKGLEIRDNTVQALEDGRERLGEVGSDIRQRMTRLKVVGQDVIDEEMELLEKGAEQAVNVIKGKKATAS